MEDNENKLDMHKLQEMYSESLECDNDVFQEQRSNILLMAGKHYEKIRRGLDRNLKSAGASKRIRLRLTKNHLQKAVSDGRDILASMTPGFVPYPAREGEASSQKAAKLAGLVLDVIKRQNNHEEWEADTRQAFTDIGEAVTKVWVDPTGGGIKGYEPKVNEEGVPLVKWQGQEFPQPMNELGEPLTHHPQTGEKFKVVDDKEKPIWRKKISLKEIEGYKLRRPKNSTSIRTAPWLLVVDVAPLETMKAQVRVRDDLTNEQKAKILDNLKASSAEPFKVFDGTTGSFQDSGSDIELREYYFRQSVQYPRGYWLITTDKDILWEGELPLGEHGEIAFPIKYAANQKFKASARGFSIIKNLRPVQAEINRLASSRAETQITMGPDKVLLQQGGKFSGGKFNNGISQYHYTGEKPTVIPGRDGAQYVETLRDEISEIYSLAKVPENVSAMAQNFDPKAELFKNHKQKARFTESAGRLSRFYRECYETALFFAQHYFTEEELVDYVGQNEAQSIPEFKEIDRNEFTLKLMEVSGDLDTTLGMQVEIETVLQYTGKDLDDVTRNRLLTQLPILNKGNAFKHLTIDLENVDADILAMDRGEYIPAGKYDNHEMYVKHLTSRIKQNDFRQKDPQVQQNYMRKLEEHEQALAEMARQAQMASQGMIPTDGPLVKVDFYINPDPNNPDKTERAVVPSNAVQWLLDTLQNQGMAQERLGEMDLVNQMNIAMQMQQQQQQEQIQGGFDGTGNPAVASY